MLPNLIYLYLYFTCFSFDFCDTTLFWVLLLSFLPFLYQLLYIYQNNVGVPLGVVLLSSLSILSLFMTSLTFMAQIPLYLRASQFLSSALMSPLSTKLLRCSVACLTSSLTCIGLSDLIGKVQLNSGFLTFLLTTPFSIILPPQVF